jgi:ribonuclease-3
MRRLYSRVRWLAGVRFSQDSHLKQVAAKLKSNDFDIARFERMIQYQPRHWDFFFQALIHRSTLQIFEEGLLSNERMEFLGDAVLGLVVADFLYRKYPAMEEGHLTKLRSRLVNRKILTQHAKHICLQDFLLLSPSAGQSIDNGADSIMGDAFEAVIGALYLDGGFKAAAQFIQRELLSDSESFKNALTDDNYKSALLEFAQARALDVPRYNVLREDGPEHDRRFTVEVVVAEQALGTGLGRSKKEAEQAAAAQAMEWLQQHNLKLKEEKKNVEEE